MDRRATAEVALQKQIEEGISKFRAAQALDELKRRYPSKDEPCPDCGSFEHFEC